MQEKAGAKARGKTAGRKPRAKTAGKIRREKPGENRAMKSHGILEDIGAELGYTATCALVDWFGGGNLYVPLTHEPGHPIEQVIGEPAFRRLVKAWAGETLWLPLGYQREQDRRDRMIAVMLAQGMGSKKVAAIAGMSESHVQHTRLRLERMGVLPLILKRAGLMPAQAADQSSASDDR